MNQEPQTRLINFGRPPKGERRVRFADTMGMELVSIFLFELINEYFHNQNNRTRKHIKAAPSCIHSSYHSNNNNSIQNNNNSNHYNSNSNSNYNSSNSIITNNKTSGYGYSSNYNSSSNITNNNNYNRDTNTATPLKAPSIGSAPSLPSPTALTPSFTCEFTQPISLLSFNERVKMNKVHLETCQINSTAGHVSVSCTIRVLNISYDKSVIVRYTTDDWRTHADSLASYKPGSSDGWSDRFSSTFTITDQVKSFQPGQRVMFAIRCVFDGNSTHWDNNGGLNYAIRATTNTLSAGR
uniref:Protein phosphatase 1 regulatory subunit 3A n=1 Tax=Aceria tosichella TaxID=561515 RepID=A0A6G1SJE1_9ACAR